MQSFRKWKNAIVLLVLLFFSCKSDSPPLVAPNEEPLIAKIVADRTSGPAVLTVGFSSQIAGGQPPCQYQWDFDSKNGIQIDNANVSCAFTYPDTGSYVVTLIVTDGQGQKSRDSVSVQVTTRAYTPQANIYLRDVHGTAESPYVIEELDISTTEGNAIQLEGCSHVLIRNNVIHDVSDPLGVEHFYLGNAIIVHNSSFVRIESNHITDNQKGIFVYADYDRSPCNDIRIYNNVVKGCELDHSINVRWVQNIEVTGNHLEHNGLPEYFMTNRLSNIYIWDFKDCIIADNYSIDTHGDGLAAGTSTEMAGIDPSFICENITIVNNTSKRSHEQGICLDGIINGQIRNNLIAENDNPDPAFGSTGISASWNVHHFVIDGNTFIDNEIGAIALHQSRDNLIIHNRIMESQAAVAAIWISDLGFSSYYPQKSGNNRILNNLIYGTSSAIRIDACQGTEIINNTLHQNGPFYSDIAGINLGDSARQTIILNNIFSFNQGKAIVCNGQSSVIAYNNFYGNVSTDMEGCAPDESNLFLDPQYCDSDHTDFRLTSTSPLRNAGSPESVYNNVDGSRNDMGAYGGPEGEW